ncbi:sensor histidine kinase [Chryseobacterium sp. CH25]|uniref:sensor histidine kinase n=2 Tax=unclassified Chryseobacterium TaxID=2593645 RepID=UPI0013E934A3|nr:ATP-binding protein [Chryseobacterium sp. CH25]
MLYPENESTIVSWIWIGIGILFLTTAFIILLVTHYFEQIRKNKRKMIQLVRNAETECWESIHYLQERDRERLSEELHDNIISQLNIIRLNINTRNGKELNSDLKRSMQLVRELSHNLTPPDLNGIELSDFISDYLVQISKEVEVLYVNHTEQDILISGTIKLNLFRIVQELITNILKHAFATEITVLLRVSVKYLSLVVKDNGRGFPMEKYNKGIGMKNIQSRSRKINAVYKFKTKPEKGTRCIVFLTLNNTKI